jgi:hypothetical protein
VAVATIPTTAAVLTPRLDLAPFELVGDRAALDRLLAERLDGRVPAPRWTVERFGVRCCRLAPRRAVILAEPGAAGPWRQVGRDGPGRPIVGVSGLDRSGAPVIRDRAGDLAVMEMSGPDATSTLTTAGLNCRLPVDAAWTGSIAGVFALVVRETGDRFLLLAPTLWPLALS